MRTLGIFVTLALAACSSTSEDESYISGFSAGPGSIAMCRTRAYRTQKPFDCCSSSYEYKVSFAVLLRADGAVASHGDGNPCGTSSAADSLPVALDDGVHVAIEPASFGVDAVATDASGMERWRTPLSIQRVLVGAHSGVDLYFSDGTNIVALDARDGSLRWDAGVAL